MPSALPRLIVDMLQNGLKHRDGSDLLDVSLPKLIVPSICYVFTADLGGFPCHWQAHVIGFFSF